MLLAEVRYGTEVHRRLYEYVVKARRAVWQTAIRTRWGFYCAIIRPITARSSEAISTFDFSIRIFPPVII